MIKLVHKVIRVIEVIQKTIEVHSYIVHVVSEIINFLQFVGQLVRNRINFSTKPVQHILNYAEGGK